MNTSPACPKCGLRLSWGIAANDVEGRAHCTQGSSIMFGKTPIHRCDWTGKVYRRADGSVSLTPEPEVRP